ncbi:MAG: sulfatase-like hydrolase/transferase [Phycisphaerales bacterium]|jgi:arylsulfatase|nr:sulfatase-like hydrolase/transferase [Phycisphaerales bacterium]MBT7170441.1 sulfatase-like hydrolase/transferase [Phycisphaerales bacterium]
MTNRQATRRTFLQTMTAAGAGLALSASPMLAAATTAKAKASQPDMLILMPDQMRGDCLSTLGHPVMRTPNMDALAKKGVLFRRAYATVASCIPARYSLLTGICPSDSGVVGFRAKKLATPTMPGILAKGGYSTVLVGRNMHQPAASGDLGYQKRILGSTYKANDEYDKYLRKAAPESGGIRNVIDKQLKISCNGWRSEAWPLDRELHPTAWVIRESQKIVKETPKDQPLFLTSSFYAPHPPLFPPKKELNYYNNKKKLPAAAKGDWVDYKNIPVATKPDGTKNHIQLTGKILHNTQAGYFGLIEQLDTEFAPLIADFTARAEAAGREWVIIVTSDHGEMLGDHGLFRKCEPLEGSANIPFIVTGSKGLGFTPGAVNYKPVCLEDIMPTLLGLAGLAVPEIASGVDLTLSLRGEKQAIREMLHFEHAPCYSKKQAFQALTDGQFKYIWRTASGKELLFNLDTDIKEETNLAKDPAHKATLELWRSRLIQRLAKRPEGFVKKGKLVAGRPYKPLNNIGPGKIIKVGESNKKIAAEKKAAAKKAAKKK